MAEQETFDYTPDLYTLVDEEGKEQTFEMLDSMELDDERYFALVPYYAEAEEMLEDDGELVILKAQVDGDEEMLASIDDDEEYERVGELFIKRLEAMFDEEDDEEEIEE